jgi:hypothetical protein
MKMNLRRAGFYLAQVIMVAASVVACGDKDDENPVEEQYDDLKLQGALTGERRLTSGKTYELIGGYQVKSGANLYVEEGVTIVATRTIDGQPDYIIVEQGGRIHAAGSKEKPVVMTSVRKQPGAWGGLHICGRAPINLAGGTGVSEIGDATFGGNDPADNSGSLKYVRLEYTGFAFSETKESNGLTLYGVGNGTQIEYVQTYRGSDDGFEWFGGTVNARYLVSTYSEDDSFDWTDGWIGKGQFWVAYQDQAPVNSEGTANGDALIEADNRENNAASTPVSCPTLSNLTLIGNNDNNAQKRGVRLRAGTYVKLYNALITGKPKPLTTATPETEASLSPGGASVIEYLHISGTFTYENGATLALETRTGNAVNQNITFTGAYIGVVDGGKDLSASDSFFVPAAYRGAVKADNDWTAGWTIK